MTADTSCCCKNYGAMSGSRDLTLCSTSTQVCAVILSYGSEKLRLGMAQLKDACPMLAQCHRHIERDRHMTSTITFHCNANCCATCDKRDSTFYGLIKWISAPFFFTYQQKVPFYIDVRQKCRLTFLHLLIQRDLYK